MRSCGDGMITSVAEDVRIDGSDDPLVGFGIDQYVTARTDPSRVVDPMGPFVEQGNSFADRSNGRQLA